jgi:hypothetical protein
LGNLFPVKEYLDTLKRISIAIDSNKIGIEAIQKKIVTDTIIDKVLNENDSIGYIIDYVAAIWEDQSIFLNRIQNEEKINQPYIPIRIRYIAPDSNQINQISPHLRK